MSDTRAVTGRAGERISRDFLRSRGYSIVSQNYRTPFGEIDLIARDKSCIVFVEVRTHISERFGSPLSSIGARKKQNILRNCRYFLAPLPEDTEGRIDVIGIILDTDLELRVLKHVKNAIHDNGSETG